MSPAQLGQDYLACANTFNAEQGSLDDQVRQLGAVTATTLAPLKSLYGKYADADATFTACIHKIAWTAQLLPDVQALLTAQATDEGLFRQAASAATPSQLATYNDQFFSADNAAFRAAVTKIRADLGLPPTPTGPPSTSGPATQGP